MTIGSEGNVGIGTSSPSVLLEIDGNQSSNGTIELARFSAHQGNAESTGLSIKGMTHSGVVQIIILFYSRLEMIHLIQRF